MKVITVGELIKNARKKIGYSANDLAKAVCVKPIEINKIESGKYTFPNPKILKRISIVLELDYNDLMYASGLGDLVSPFNMFVLEYYMKLKEKETLETINNLSRKIKENGKVIKHLKSSIEDLNNKDYHSLLQEDIDSLEYENHSLKLIIKLLKSKIIRGQYLKNNLSLIDKIKNYFILSRSREI